MQIDSIKKRIHGLRVKKGLRNSWLKACIKRNNQGQAEMAKKDIEKYNNQIKSELEFLDYQLNKTTKQ